MLKKIIPLLLGLVGITQASHAQNSLLWKISGKGMTKPSYVFGTMHMICPDDYFMSESVKKAFKSADTVYMEMDMDDPMMMIKVGQLSQLPEGKTLDKIFTEKEYKELAAYMKANLKLDLALFNQFKPLVLTSLLTTKSFKCETPASYEMNFVEMASEQRKTILGLETPEQQISVFDAVDDRKEAEMIMKSIREKEKESVTFNKMITLYKKQDVNGLYKLMKETNEMDGFEEELLTKRNNNWVPAIRKVIGGKTQFFAVGALHLAGPHGVLTQLKAAGYTVTPVL
ncbi:TraB/GumN family protein [Chitinophaga horti]|uniref:TraB/GumN family protein n=1 Tax=Chitinophaga horti TaxID=2920382 RepID=A0ABY6IUW7_9BACT|nr:TraB/GumN family protein [Chitinophaga horti]UYQ91090.1 TraB/GumN family protein [Chitinophaga horti]